MARNGAGELLLMRRADEGTWGLPGGGVEGGETWELGAKRECLEETGWTVRVTGVLGVYSDPETQTHTYPSGERVHFVGGLCSPLTQSSQADPVMPRQPRCGSFR